MLTMPLYVNLELGWFHCIWATYNGCLQIIYCVGKVLGSNYDVILGNIYNLNGIEKNNVTVKTFK